jgi:GNAT superfamily N-acetyltransferase
MEETTPYNIKIKKRPVSFNEILFDVLDTEKEITIGEARLFLHNLESELDHIKIEESFRGQGIGSRLLTEIEATAKKWGANKILLNSKSEAIKFYIKNGYTAVNNPDWLQSFEKEL